MVGAYASARAALAKGQKIATLKAPGASWKSWRSTTPTPSSGPEGNRAYQRDVLRAFDDNDSSDDEARPAPRLMRPAPATPMDVDDDDAPAAPPPLDDDDDDDDAVTPLLAVDETVLVGSNKHVAKVERATKPGDDVVLVRWQSTGHRERSTYQKWSGSTSPRDARRAGRRRRRAKSNRKRRRRRRR